MTTISEIMQNRFAIFMTMFQLLMLLFFGLFTTYSDDGYAEAGNSKIEEDPYNNRGVGFKYAMFQDIHVMMFIGFGYLMTFMRKNCFNSVGLTFLLGAQVIQWCILCRGFFEQAISGHKWQKIPLSLDTFVNADFCVAAILISYGGVLGKLGPFELAFMAFVEVVVYALNEAICVEKFESADVGGSMYIHTFGAYFGLTVALIISKKDARTEKQNSSYTTDTFAMIGTIFLWLFWPSFNGAMATGSSQHRVVINTILSLCGACCSTFVVSSLFRHGNKFDMVEIQNATLAGGVAVGCSADFIIRPWGAMLIGMSAGCLSTIGFIFIQPWLERKIGLHDSCGIHNLHGMPGILGGVAGIVSAAVASDSLYGTSVGKVFPARAPSDPNVASNLGVEVGKDRSASSQAWYQLAALLLSLGLAIAGGILTGVILKFSRVFSILETEAYFDDVPFWHVNHPVDDDTKTIAMHELPKTTTTV